MKLTGLAEVTVIFGQPGRRVAVHTSDSLKRSGLSRLNQLWEEWLLLRPMKLKTIQGGDLIRDSGCNDAVTLLNELNI